MLAFSIVPSAAFAAVSASGVRASSGSRPFCAGRVSVTAVAALAASTYTRTAGASSTSAAAVAATVIACAPYASTRIRPRG
jgi:hypothetical protein